MSTSYPAGIDSYTTKVDSVDDVLASHINNPQDAIVALQTALGVGTVIETTWTPVLSQLAVVAATINYAKYRRIGKLVHIECKLTATAIGAAANPIYVGGWPAAIDPVVTGAAATVGRFGVFDTSVAPYPGLGILYGMNVAGFWQPTANYIGTNPNFALDVGDEVYLNCSWFIA